MRVSLGQCFFSHSNRSHVSSHWGTNRARKRSPKFLIFSSLMPSPHCGNHITDVFSVLFCPKNMFCYNWAKQLLESFCFFFSFAVPPLECWSAIFSVLAPITNIITFKTTLVIFSATSWSSSGPSALTTVANMPGNKSCRKTSFVLIGNDLEKNCFQKNWFSKSHVISSNFSALRPRNW